MKKLKKVKNLSAAADVGQKKESKVIPGEILSPGLAKGEAFIYRDILSRNILHYDLQEGDVQEELKRIHEALAQVHQDLQQTKEVVTETVNKENADIFEVHKMILKDEQLLLDLEKELSRELINAEQIVRNVFRKWANRFRASENEAIQEKADDMDDLSRRIIRELLGYERNVLERLPANSIIVAKRLLPSDTVHLNRTNVKGVVVEEGGYNSHSAILARSLDVPAICCHSQLNLHIKAKSFLLIDGDNEKVIVHPGAIEQEEFEKRAEEFRGKKSFVLRKAKQSAKTKDGRSISVCANATTEDDFKIAVKNGCDGIGLFRIENLYLEHKTAPSQDYLVKRLKQILECAPGKKVVLRLLDIGGDKKLPYIDVEGERNPFLGLRGIRMLLKHLNILRTQIQVVCDLHDQFNVELLVPMVSVPQEMNAVREVIKEFEGKDKAGSKLRVGAMIETPAAVANIEQIAQQSDFLSIGTNDLIQYTMAIGRENANMDEYYSDGVETVMKLIEKVVQTADQYSIPCCICGELAADEQYTEALLKTGLKELSVSSNRIPFIKQKIRSI